MIMYGFSWNDTMKHKRRNITKVEKIANAYHKVSKLHNLGWKVGKEWVWQSQELCTKHWQEMPRRKLTPPLPILRDNLEDI